MPASTVRRACLVLAVLLLSCAEAQPPVVRIGNDALEKSAFEGEWYYLQTVIDTPYSIPYTFVGEQSLLERIEWQIEEDLLIARRSYEFVAGAEGEGIAGGASTRGAPVAMYRIVSHFDIRRTYNTITGEQENVVVEASDRPWHLRQFMRVDWSQNLITEGEFLSYARLFDGIEVEPVAYEINDPGHPDHPRFGFDADDQLHYFDVVNRMLVRPTEIEIEGYRYPSCWLEYQTHVDCGPAEIGVRRSYLRVDPTRDYQPRDYSGDRMERFGYFVSERAGYDPHYGAVEPARARWINRHNIWMTSHRTNEDGSLVACSSDADCDPAAGSVCDGHLARAQRSATGACTIPYREREVRPIVYYVSERFPEDMIATARASVTEWNETFVSTVASLRENECRAAGGDPGACAAERGREDGAPIFVLCQNPVTEEDPEVCGEAGTEARIGDLRYSLLAWVPEPHEGSPLGYGPSSADPVTGEVVQANAFVYGAGIETLASYARDLVGVLNGDIDEEEIADGVNVARWLERVSGAGGRTIPFDGADASRIEAALDLSRITGGRRGEPPPRSRDLPAQRSAAVRSLSRRGAFGQPTIARARMDAIRGTPMESLLLHPDLHAAAGIDPDMPTSEAVLDRASPLRGLSLGRRRALDRARRRLMRERCVLRAADFADEGLLGLARAIREAATSGDGTMTWYGQVFPLGAEGGAIDYDAVRAMMRHPIFHSTAAHEIGHTLGLRHNFSGSYDAMNYAPGYWETRNDGSMRPRAWDPISDAEIAGRQRELQYSTVMDYGNNFVVTDAAGLGHYDHAAIKMGYGDLVEVFTAASDPTEVAWVYFQQLFGWPGPLTYDSFFEGMEIRTHHYTDLPALAGGISGLEARADVAYDSLRADATLASDDGIDLPLVDEAGRPAVPYRFCSDELSDLAPDCMLYDAGADDYESLSSIIDSYWSYYIFSNFRRERLGFDVSDHWDRVYFRYFSKLQYANQTYVFNRAFMTELFGEDASLDTFFERENGFGPQTLSIGAAFALLTRVVTAPEPGGYVEYALADGTSALLLDEFARPDVAVDALEGRYLETAWDFDAGYYWFDQLDRVGFFVDKVMALLTLVDPETSFLGQDTEADVRGFAINFASSFPQATTALVRGVLAEDYQAIGPRAGPGGTLVYPDPLELTDGSLAGTPIDPNTDFSVQLYAAAFGMGLIPATYDDQFFEQSRIFLLGSAEEVAIPDLQQVTFVDPFTSLTYVAGSYPDAAGVETGLGARMLLHAGALDAAGETFALDQYLDVVRNVRALSWYYGFGL